MSTLKRGVALIFLLFIVSPLLWLSWWLVLMLLVGVAYYFLFFKLTDHKLAGGLVYVLTIGVLLLLANRGILVTSHRIPSCLSGPREALKSFALTRPPALSLTDAQVLQRENRRIAEAATQRASTAQDVSRISQQVRDLMMRETSAELAERRIAINKQLGDISEFRSRPSVANIEKLQESFGNYKKAVMDVVEESDKTTDLTKLKALKNKLYDTRDTSDLERLALLIDQLKDNVLLYKNQKFGVDATTREIEYDEDHGELVFREDIALKSSEQAYITSIDASALQTEASSSGTKGVFSVKYADGRIQPASDPNQIPVDPPQKQVILRYERTAAVQPLAGCNQAPLATIRRLAFVWPASNSSTNMMATVVIGDAVVLPVPFTIERKDATVKDIVVPPNSLFTASEELKVENNGKTDLLSKKDSDVKISGLSPDSDFWVEFLENRWLLRNSLLYPHRDYLVAENAIAAVLSILIGLVAGKLLPKMPEGNERKEG